MPETDSFDLGLDSGDIFKKVQLGFKIAMVSNRSKSM